MLNKKDLQQLIELTRLQTRLSSAVIEKDYYVTQVIQSLSAIENENFRLVFSGGTCLAKAHRIVDRMSEDIDFKIQTKNNQTFSRSKLIRELKIFRQQIQSELAIPNLAIIENITRNEGKYHRIKLQYPHSYPILPTLRPNLLLEFTFTDIRLPVLELSVKTIIEYTLNRELILKLPNTLCVSADETAIEKWVGLTRRVVAMERDPNQEDTALVRHVYDLSFLKQANKIHENFFILAKDIVISDGAQYKNQHPEYSENPIAEIQQSIELLKNKPSLKENYSYFLNSMVFDPSTAPDYYKAVAMVENISEGVISLL